MYFWLHQCNSTKGMFLQVWQTLPQYTICVYSKTLILCSHILCVFHDIMHFLQGPCQMSLRTMFPGFYTIFRWPQKNLKCGYNCVCVCMHAHKAFCHLHTHTHTQNLLGIHAGYNVKYEGGKMGIEFLFPISQKEKTSLFVRNNFSDIIRFTLGLQARNFKFANIKFSLYSRKICKPHLV